MTALNPWNYYDHRTRKIDFRSELLSPLEARKLLNLSQKAMAASLDISLRRWQYLESEQRHPTKCETIAIIFLFCIDDRLMRPHFYSCLHNSLANAKKRQKSNEEKRKTRDRLHWRKGRKFV